MARASNIRAAVRAQLAATLKAREDAAISVATALEKLDAARARVTELDQEAAAAVAAATDHLSLAELAELTGTDPRELRRLSRATPAPAGAGTDGRQGETGAGAEPAAHVPAPRQTPATAPVVDDATV